MDRKRIVFTFGRFNPPTTGHEKLIEAVAKEAGKDDYIIVPTRSFDKKKNPLDIDTKVFWMKKMFPDHADKIITSKDLNVIIKVMQSFQGTPPEGYTDVCMVVGSDRVSGFTTLLNKYNMDINDTDKVVEYAFTDIEVKSAGERDPDNDDDTSGMSASKMRDYAKNLNAEKFVNALKGLLDPTEALSLMTAVRKGMGL